MGLSLLGLSAFLPPLVRTNDAWPKAVVDAWLQHGAFSPERATQATGVFAEGDGPRRVFEAMRALASDPFHGAVERRVMPEGMSAVDMGTVAAEGALRDAGIEPSSVDFVLGSSFAPDLQNSPDVCGLHGTLGLRRDCLVVTVDAVCNSFQAQLALAEGLLAGTRHKIGLLVQASAASRVLPMAAPLSVHFGDGASAVVVGQGERRRLIAQRFEAESDLYRAMALTVPGRHWWEEGRVVATPLDKEAARRMMPVAPDAARRLLSSALQHVGAEVDDVNFFACHQPTVWFRRVVQDHAGLTRARSLDTYPEAGTVSAANIPLVLHRARAQGLLEDGDLVAVFQSGTGATHAASLIRW